MNPICHGFVITKKKINFDVFTQHRWPSQHLNHPLLHYQQNWTTASAVPRQRGHHLPSKFSPVLLTDSRTIHIHVLVNIKYLGILATIKLSPPCT